MKQLKRILIADDNPDNLKLTWNYINNFGIDVEVFLAHNGKMAYQIALEHLPHLVITDWDMPEMDGIELIQQLYKMPQFKNMPVLVFSGVMTRSENLHIALEAGAFDFFRKPIDAVEFEARLKSALRYGESLQQLQDKVEELQDVQKSLYKSRERLQLALNASTDGLFDINITTGETYISPRWFGILGYAPDEVTMSLRRFFAMLHPNDRPAAKKLWHDLTTEQTLSLETEYRLKTKSGQWVWIFCRASLVTTGSTKRLVGTHTDINRRKKEEQQLKQERTQFLALLDSIPEIIYVADTSTFKLLFVNKAMQDIVGKNSIGQQCFNVLWGKSEQCDFCTNSIIRNNKDQAHRWEYYNPQLERHFSVVDKIIKWTDGREVRFEMAVDITQRKKAEIEVKQSEAKYRLLADNVSDIIWIFDVIKRRIEYVSPSIEKIIGYTPEEFLKLKFSEFYTKESLELTHRMLAEKQFLEKKDYSSFCVQKEIITKDRKNKWVEENTTPLLDKNGNYTGKVLGVSRDVTQRRQTEIELRKLTAAVTQSPVAIVITDIDANIEYVNPYFVQQTGYTAEEVLGENPRILNSGRTPYQTFINLWATVTVGKTWRGEFINRKKNGEEYWEQAVISPITNEHNEVISYIAVKENITQRKKSQDALKKSEKELREANVAKDKFFSIIAHDLKNPFNALKGFSDLLLRLHNEMTPEKREEFIRSIHNSANRTYELLENLLVWSRAQTNRISFAPENLVLAQQIENNLLLMADMAKKKNISLKQEVPGKIVVSADKNMVTTVLRNLISNAIKFTPKGGTVTVTACRQDENMAEIEVKDTGIGISPENIDKLFRIDTSISTAGTNNESGSGLGLILCKEFITKNGGQISVHSVPGKGSRFVFTLKTITPKKQPEKQKGTKVNIETLKQRLATDKALNDLVKQKILPDFEVARKKLSIRLFKQFATLLIQTGRSHELPAFENYGNNLLFYVGEFKLHQVNQLFDELEQLFRHLGL